MIKRGNAALARQGTSEVEHSDRRRSLFKVHHQDVTRGKRFSELQKMPVEALIRGLTKPDQKEATAAVNGLTRSVTKNLAVGLVRSVTRTLGNDDKQRYEPPKLAEDDLPPDEETEQLITDLESNFESIE